MSIIPTTPRQIAIVAAIGLALLAVACLLKAFGFA